MGLAHGDLPSGGTVDGPGSGPSDHAMPKKLLLADDSITIQKVIGITFANEDFALTTVDNGVDAIQTAKRIKPDLILADVVMPGKNGYEVCEYVKHDPELRGTPVLLLAGTFESFEEAEMARVGADGYITKPFESQTLIDRVHELTSRMQPTPAPPARTAVPRPPAQPGAAAPSPARTPAGGPHGSPTRAVPPAAAAPPAAAPDSFNLDDFSPFEEVAAEEVVQGEEPAVAEAANQWDAQNGSGDEEVWDLSDFEPSAEGGIAEQAEALFAEAEAAVDASGEAATGIEGEQTFDFSEAEPADAAEEADPFATADDAFTAEAEGEALLDPAPEDFGSTDDGFGGNGELAAGLVRAAESPSDTAAPEGADEAMELTDLEEVTELEDLEPVEEDPLAAAPEAEVAATAPADAADGWQVERVSQVKPAGRAPAAPIAMGALASRVKQAAEGLTGEIAARGTLPAAQVEAIITRVAREVIEEVAWEVVPDLCEQLIRAEIRKVTGK